MVNLGYGNVSYVWNAFYHILYVYMLYIKHFNETFLSTGGGGDCQEGDVFWLPSIQGKSSGSGD